VQETELLLQRMLHKLLRDDMLSDNLVLRVDVVVRLRVLLWDDHLGAEPLQRHVICLRSGGLPKYRVCPELPVRELRPEFVRLPLGS
jgi:hypothetical protein